jgi:hypothetical protein
LVDARPRFEVLSVVFEEVVEEDNNDDELFLEDINLFGSGASLCVIFVAVFSGGRNCCCWLLGFVAIFFEGFSIAELGLEFVAWKWSYPDCCSRLFVRFVGIRDWPLLNFPSMMIFFIYWWCCCYSIFAEIQLDHIPLGGV